MFNTGFLFVERIIILLRCSPQLCDFLMCAQGNSSFVWVFLEDEIFYFCHRCLTKTVWGKNGQNWVWIWFDFLTATQLPIRDCPLSEKSQLSTGPKVHLSDRPLSHKQMCIALKGRKYATHSTKQKRMSNCYAEWRNQTFLRWRHDPPCSVSDCLVLCWLDFLGLGMRSEIG